MSTILRTSRSERHYDLGWYALALSVASKYYSPHRAMKKLNFMTKEEYEADRTKEDDNNAAAWWMYTNNQWKREDRRRKNKLKTLWRRWDEVENKAQAVDPARDDDSNGDRYGGHCRGGRSGKGGRKMDVRNNYFALYSIRKARNISAAAVAIALGISSDRYVRLEKNELKRVKPEEMAMLSHFFNLPEEVLFKTNLEPNKYCSRCKTRKMPLDELEKMLAEQFGRKLKPIKKDRP